MGVTCNKVISCKENTFHLDSTIREKEKEYEKSVSYLLTQNLSRKIDTKKLFKIPELKQEKEKLFMSFPYFAEAKTSGGLNIPQELINCDEGNYHLILPGKKLNFCNDFVDEINKARYNCLEYSKKINKFAEKIQTDHNTSQQYICLNDNYKIYLQRGKSAFKECSNYLTKLYTDMEEKFSFLKEIKKIDELALPFPGQQNKYEESFNISNIKSDLKKEVEGRYDILDYQFEACVNDSEISFIFFLVDDSSYNKEIRDLIFDKNVKYIGVNYKNIDVNLGAINLVFAC